MSWEPLETMREICEAGDAMALLLARWTGKLCDDKDRRAARTLIDRWDLMMGGAGYATDTEARTAHVEMKSD